MGFSQEIKAILILNAENKKRTNYNINLETRLDACRHIECQVEE